MQNLTGDTVPVRFFRLGDDVNQLHSSPDSPDHQPGGEPAPGLGRAVRAAAPRAARQVCPAAGGIAAATPQFATAGGQAGFLGFV